ncbi:hypothetical protein Tcan_01114, partial [Toxocara canis]
CSTSVSSSDSWNVQASDLKKKKRRNVLKQCRGVFGTGRRQQAQFEEVVGVGYGRRPQTLAPAATGHPTPQSGCARKATATGRRLAVMRTQPTSTCCLLSEYIRLNVVSSISTVPTSASHRLLTLNNSFLVRYYFPPFYMLLS